MTEWRNFSEGPMAWQPGPEERQAAADAGFIAGAVFGACVVGVALVVGMLLAWGIAWAFR